ncbi:chromosome segregation ATPase [Luteibacter sp. Sphag1AF]|uniref:DNA-binding protein n=1 Tax=Luteibacter sp. Sphag1AF TaxID=2587031 RepID=UPI00161E45EC|nr:DNA-binding protein [Luteibacter sp. Sphag1AF]MBB3228175.1 chromosome segregation ATPase [Luteibacter sp. Sphag1AF]
MNDENSLNALEQQVRAAWEARCGVRRGPLDQADVDAIAEAAFALEGTKPTVEFIRRIAGGGSPNTIHPKLDAWFRQGRQAAGPSAVPAELITLWERLQADATRFAQDELSPLRAAIADDQAALAAEAAQLAASQAALADERATTERVVTAMREEFQGLQGRNEALQRELARVNDQAREAAEMIKQRNHEVERLQREGATAKTEHSHLTNLLAAADVRYASQQAELKAVREATLAIETQALALRAEAAESANALVKAQQRAELQDRELGAAQTTLATLTDRVDQLEQALQLAQTTAKADASLHDHVAADLRREREALVAVRAIAARASEALAASQATAAALVQERDRLHAVLMRVSPDEPTIVDNAPG